MILLNNIRKNLNNSEIGRKINSSKLGQEIINRSGDNIDKSPKHFSLLLITTSEKIRDKIEASKVKNGDYNEPASLEIVKNLINTSRYFLIENADAILEEAKTSIKLPDLNKDNLFLLKITGQGRHDISKYNTKLWLRDSIISETCQIEKVFHLLDANIAEKFVPTI